MMSKWTWCRAAGTDVTDIGNIARAHFRSEITDIWALDEVAFNRNLTLDIVRQFYNPGMALVTVARDPAGQILGYTWCERGQRAVWSDEEMICVKMVHVDLDLSSRDRVRLIQEMMEQWELWAVYCNIDIICSTTMRHHQDAFLKLHARNGYSVRGSICYKRIV
ncbi:hypothetical protein UFOVP849_7 [uncultured Caudovirales phage]|uniref:Uncharacterized protein n=1 Tax=uncultured Caudovirales phage TaxID=2100421 RepID=A0A6J5P9S1_9CAUD|nr:hypothetical protein UFOVP849_7 [uncultured Caudovirales phage]